MAMHLVGHSRLRELLIGGVSHDRPGQAQISFLLTNKCLAKVKLLRDDGSMNCPPSRFVWPYAFAMALLSGCSSGGVAEPAPTETAAFSDAIAEAPAKIASIPAALPSPVIPATITAIGTEPFWSVHIEKGVLTYNTPEIPVGIEAPVGRKDQADRTVFSATIDGAPLVLEVTYGDCSDGMSDTNYPMAVTRRIGDDIQHGCAS